MKRVKLSSKELDFYDSYADLFSILVATEALEKSFIKSTISTEEYNKLCIQLISQYKTIVKINNINIAEFIKEHEIGNYAYKRLVEIGVPATVEHNINDNSNNNSKKYIAETVQFFITLMDSLKLGVVAVDELHPMLSDLIMVLHKSVGAETVGKQKIREWLIILNGLQASDELAEAQTRQLLFDLERYLVLISAYAEFQHSLSN